MTRLMLQRGGHEVTITADGADGIKKAQQIQPDMAIIDVMMPGMNGYQVVRRLRETPETAKMVVLILTARAQPVDRDTALASRADEYMAKPVAPAELLKKVNELLTRGSQTALVPKLALTVFSLRGGVGVTSLATNLALAFQQSNRRVCLVDLCTRSGHAALHLRLQVKNHWGDVLPQYNILSSDMLDKLLLKHDSGLRVLPAPFLPPMQPVNEEALGKVFSVLKSMFDTVICDSSGALDIVTRTALQAADHVLTILTPEVASLQTTAAKLRILGAMTMPEDKVILVSNQVMPRAGLSQQAIEKALNRQLKIVIPYDETQMQALAQGTPLVQSNPDAPLAGGVKQIINLFAQKRT
jgi:pilus assembly protein CpaE